MIYEHLPSKTLLDGPRTQFQVNPGDTIFYHPMLAHGFATSLASPLRALTAHFASSDCDYVTMSGHESALSAKHMIGDQVRCPW